MSEIRIMKRGKVYQYRFEIASRGGVRRYINKSGFESRKEAQEAGAIAYNEYFKTGKPLHPQTADRARSDVREGDTGV